MSHVYTDDQSLAREAYAIAWKSFVAFAWLTPGGKESASRKLQEYIDVLVSSGERGTERIAQSALGLLREYEQIMQSTARVSSSPSISP